MADNPYKDHILSEVRHIGGLWMRLSALHEGASTATMRKIEKLVGPPNRLTNAKAWRLTLDIVMGHVDRELQVRNACRAMLARHVIEARWVDVAEQMGRPVPRCKEIVDQATARFYAELVARGITDDYREEENAA